MPTEISVSMVAAPCRALVQAALWKGQAAYVTTGAASVSDSHCQYSNCRAGTIAIATTGTASATAVIRPLAQRPQFVGLRFLRRRSRTRIRRARGPARVPGGVAGGLHGGDQIA